MLKLAHVIGKNWDIQDTTPTFEFYFRLILPKPQRDRLISERNTRGQIVKSKVPVII